MARDPPHDQSHPADQPLSRRAYLHGAAGTVAGLLGTSATPAATPATAAPTSQDATGFGAGGYGDGGYGDPTDSATPSTPQIEAFEIATSDRLGDNRMFSVTWTVASTDTDLDTVEVVVHDPDLNLNFAVTDVAGTSASGWDLFQFPLGTGLTVRLRVTDTAGHATTNAQSITL